MRISTMVTDITNFNAELLQANEIGIEIQTFPQSILDLKYESLLESWKTKLTNYNETVSIHGSAYDLNPGSTDKKVIEVTKYRYLQSIDIAKELKCNYVVFHSQVNPLLSVKRIRELKVHNQINFWNELFEEYIPENMCILIENEYDDTVDDIKKILEGVNRHNFGMCLDIGHVLAYSKEGLAIWFRELYSYIKYIHLHWNDGSHDEHRKPREHEIIELGKLLSEFKIDPVITLEYIEQDIIDETARVKRFLNHAF